MLIVFVFYKLMGIMSFPNPFSNLEALQKAITMEEDYDREIARLRENRERLGQQLKTQAQVMREKRKRQNAER